MASHYKSTLDLYNAQPRMLRILTSAIEKKPLCKAIACHTTFPDLLVIKSIHHHENQLAIKECPIPDCTGRTKKMNGLNTGLIIRNKLNNAFYHLRELKRF